MKQYLIGIGKRIKEIRKENNETISIIAEKATVSKGLISRIENGRTIPSLPVLLNIINALDIAVTDFFNGMPEYNDALILVSRADENTIVEKEDNAKGFEYKHIFSKQFSSIGFEAVILTIEPNSKRDKVTTDAYEYKYILSGACQYDIGEEEVSLKEGDAIFFDGRIPHVPSNQNKEVCKMLVLYFFV